MTEELEQKAEEKYCKNCKSRQEQCLWAWRNTNGLDMPNEKNCSCKEVPAYIAGATEATKELQEENLKLEAKIRTLEIEQHYCLPNCSKLAELEAQLEQERNLNQCRFDHNEQLREMIEKMRNCANCKNYNANEGFCVLGSGYGYNCNLEKWEIKEK